MWLCYPTIPAWYGLGEIFRASFSKSGADLEIGRRLTELLRAARLGDIQVVAHTPLYLPDHSRRTIRADLVRGLWPTILRLGLADEQQLADLDTAMREHLADPQTLVMSHILFVAWGRKPRS